jgi:hypothetical protein
MQGGAHGSAYSAHARFTEPDGRAFAHRDSDLGHATSHDSATDPCRDGYAGLHAAAYGHCHTLDDFYA